MVVDHQNGAAHAVIVAQRSRLCIGADPEPGPGAHSGA
jgi:hypothetical protein